MEESQRIKKAINWLIYNEKANNEREIAEILGYTKSSFSQIVNGKVPLSEKFAKKLCSLDPNINFVWIMKGEGEMFNSDDLNSEVTIPSQAWRVIQEQAASLSSKDRQIEDLIGMLREQLQEAKKSLARQENNVGSAAVG